MMQLKTRTLAKLPKETVNPDDYLGNYAAETDVSNLITESTRVVDETGDTILAYIRNIDFDVEPLRQMLHATSITGSERATKKFPMKTQSVTFGYLPALYTRNHPCRVSRLARSATNLHEHLVWLTATIADYYRQLSPDIAAYHQQQTQERIKPEYRMLDTMYTSGIINKSSQLPYHYDAGNFKNTWSAMLGLSKGIEGGSLVLPEYNVAFDISDGCLCFFDGQKRVHGVTPIHREHPKAERYTIVWYSLERLWACESTADEIRKMNASQTAKNRAKTKAMHETVHDAGN